MWQMFDRKRPGNLLETARIVGPLALAMAAGTANHLCDRLFLAHVGDAALEAVLPADMLTQIVTQFLAASIGYSATFVAQEHGGGRIHQAVKSFAQGLWLCLLTIPVFLAVVPAGRLLIALAGHEPGVQAAELAYFTIAAPGGFLVVLNTVLAGILTGQGHTRYVGFCTIVGCLANLALDPILIFGGLGIAGAATATVTAYLITTVLLSAKVIRDPLVRDGVRAGDFSFSLPRTLAILRFGLPLGVISFFGCASFTLFTFATGTCGPVAFAASNTVFAVNNVFYLSTCATSQGINILTARYHGARNDEAAARVFQSGLFLVGSALLVCFAVAIPGAGFIMDFFRGATSTHDPAAFRQCGFYLFVIMFFREIAEGMMLIAGGALRGVGDTKYVMCVQATIEIFLRVPLILIVSSCTQSIYLLWITMPIDMGLTSLFLALRWYGGKWRRIRLTGL